MKEHRHIKITIGLIATFLLCLVIYPYFQPIEEFILDAQELALIKKLANLSELSYDSKQSILDNSAELGCIKTYTGRQQQLEMSWMLIECLDTIFISVQGTANMKNVQIDLDHGFVSEPSLGIEVHSGFDSAALKIYSQIETDIPGVFDKQKEYVFTGHSLGGATALLMGMKAQKSGCKVRVVTFGQPKITNKEGAEVYLDFPLLRVVMLDDPIANNTKSLWHFLLKKPTYFGSLLMLVGDQKYLPLKEELFDTRSLDETTKVVNSHFISNYIQALKEVRIESERSYLDERLLVFDILYSSPSDF